MPSAGVPRSGVADKNNNVLLTTSSDRMCSVISNRAGMLDSPRWRGRDWIVNNRNNALSRQLILIGMVKSNDAGYDDDECGTYLVLYPVH